jgi:hypothetical protein
MLPVIGAWYDTYGGATAFRYVGFIPIVLIVVFAALSVHFKSKGGYRTVRLEPSMRSEA